MGQDNGKKNHIFHEKFGSALIRIVRTSGVKLLYSPNLKKQKSSVNHALISLFKEKEVMSYKLSENFNIYDINIQDAVHEHFFKTCRQQST